MDTINKRIDIVITDLNLTNKEFGDQLGFTEATARNLRNNGVVKDVYVEIISSKWGYSLEWLKEGKGDKLKKETNRNNPDKDIRQLALDCMENWEYLIEDKIFNKFFTAVIGEKFNIDFEKILNDAIDHKKKL